MNYIGKWVFDSIGTQDDEKGMIYLNGDEYLASPMPYIDETDEEAVADEINERKKTIGMQVKICDDGKLYFLIMNDGKFAMHKGTILVNSTHGQEPFRIDYDY